MEDKHFFETLSLDFSNIIGEQGFSDYLDLQPQKEQDILSYYKLKNSTEQPKDLSLDFHEIDMADIFYQQQSEQLASNQVTMKYDQIHTEENFQNQPIYDLPVNVQDQGLNWQQELEQDSDQDHQEETKQIKHSEPQLHRRNVPKVFSLGIFHLFKEDGISQQIEKVNTDLKGQQTFEAWIKSDLKNLKTLQSYKDLAKDIPSDNGDIKAFKALIRSIGCQFFDVKNGHWKQYLEKNSKIIRVDNFKKNIKSFYEGFKGRNPQFKLLD